MENAKLLGILNSMSEFSTSDLKELTKAIRSTLNYRNHQTLMENKHSIKVGDYVTVDHPKTQGKTFQVTSMRRTRATIKCTKNPLESFTLPITMMIKTNYEPVNS
tara:strand:- start:1188 stop:1502 length:315 start_codon:yes stop_codon:yes gene_type:complete